MASKGKQIHENEFECVRCGAPIYIELTRCPNCGLPLYEVDQESDWQLEWKITPSRPRRILRAAAGIFSGWLAAFAIAFGLYLLVFQLFPHDSITLAGEVILFAAGPLGASAGGYLGAAIPDRRGMLSSLLISILTAASLVLLETTRRQITPGWLLGPHFLAQAALILIAGQAGSLLYWRMSGRLAAQQDDFEQEYTLYKRLLLKVGADQEAVERLIEYERRMRPNARRMVLIEHALQRLDHDRQ